MEFRRRAGMIVPKQPIGCLHILLGDRAPARIGGRLKRIDTPRRNLCNCRSSGDCHRKSDEQNSRSAELECDHSQSLLFLLARTGSANGGQICESTYSGWVGGWADRFQPSTGRICKAVVAPSDAFVHRTQPGIPVPKLRVAAVGNRSHGPPAPSICFRREFMVVHGYRAVWIAMIRSQL